MGRRSVFAKCLWVLAIAVLVARVGDAHLHFCADGQEQSMALHMSDAPGPHHADEAGSDHDDRDLDVSGPTFVKKVGGLDELAVAVLFVVALVLLLPILRSIEPIPDIQPLFLKPVFALRPPLRGPPR